MSGNVWRIDGRACARALEDVRRATGSAGLHDRGVGWYVWPDGCPICGGALVAADDLLPLCRMDQGCLPSAILTRLRAKPGPDLSVANHWRDVRHYFERRHNLPPLDGPIAESLRLVRHQAAERIAA